MHISAVEILFCVLMCVSSLIHFGVLLNHDSVLPAGICKKNIRAVTIGHVNDYPTMHYFGIPRCTQSMKAYDKILTEYF